MFTPLEEVLKDFYDKIGTEYNKFFGYSKTIWLALMSALEEHFFEYR